MLISIDCKGQGFRERVLLLRTLRSVVCRQIEYWDCINRLEGLVDMAADLARAHARTSDAAAIAGYCGKSAILDDAFATWAEAYSEQTRSDHESLVNAIKSGRVKAITGV